MHHYISAAEASSALLLLQKEGWSSDINSMHHYLRQKHLLVAAKTIAGSNRTAVLSIVLGWMQASSALLLQKEGWGSSRITSHFSYFLHLSFSTNIGKLRPCTEKWFSLPYTYAQSDSLELIPVEVVHFLCYHKKHINNKLFRNYFVPFNLCYQWFVIAMEIVYVRSR